MTDYQKQLQKEGWFVVRGVLRPEDIQIALERLRQIAANIDECWKVLPIIKETEIPSLREDPDPLKRFEWIDGIGYYDAVLWKHVTAHPRLMEIAASVVGGDVFPLNGGGFFMKPPGSNKVVPWHQDASPFRAEPENGRATVPLVFDFWLGLTEATEEMGCLQLVPGSQHLGRVEHRDRGELHVSIDPSEHGFTDADIVKVPTGPGDLIVWHQDMFHGSEPNRGTQSRIAVASVYHGRSEEDSLRRNHQKGAIRRRPQLASNGKPLPLEDPFIPPWEGA
jgi:hypothetical protein